MKHYCYNLSYMSKSKNLVKSKLFRITALVVLILVVLIAATFGRKQWRESTSSKFFNLAINNQSKAEAPIWFEFAALLSSRPTEVRLQESLFYLGKNQPDAAISLIAADKSDSAQLQIASIQYQYGRLTAARATAEAITTDSNAKNALLGRIYLEVGEDAKAITAAKQLASNDPTGGNRLQLGLDYLVVGDTANAQATVASLEPSEALGILRQASVDKYSLAVTLAHSGLLNTSERVLDGIQQKASDEWQLWGTVRMAHKPSLTDLKLTADNLTTAVKADPSSIKLRKLLREVYAKQNDEAGITSQTDLINRLESGTP